MHFIYRKKEPLPIAVTDDKKLRKAFLARMERIGVKVKVVKDNPPKEVMDSEFFTDIEILDMKPYIDTPVTNQELQHLYGFISEMAYQLQEAVNTLQFGIVDVQFEHDEKTLIELMVEHIDMICMDLIDGEMSSGYMTFDDYLDIESILKRMYTTKAEPTIN